MRGVRLLLEYFLCSTSRSTGAERSTIFSTKLLSSIGLLLAVRDIRERLERHQRLLLHRVVQRRELSAPTTQEDGAAGRLHARERGFTVDQDAAVVARLVRYERDLQDH